MTPPLPEMPNREAVDRLIAQFPENKVITASAIAQFSQNEADALRARLRALAEYTDHLGDCAGVKLDDSDCTCGIATLLSRLRREGLVE